MKRLILVALTLALPACGPDTEVYPDTYGIEMYLMLPTDPETRAYIVDWCLQTSGYDYQRCIFFFRSLVIGDLPKLGLIVSDDMGPPYNLVTQMDVEPNYDFEKDEKIFTDKLKQLVQQRAN